MSTDEGVKVSTDDEDQERKKPWGYVKPNSKIFGPFGKL